MRPWNWVLLESQSVQSNHVIPIFWENQLFVFREVPKTLLGLRNPSFFLGGGGHTPKTFWSRQQFWRYSGLILPKNGYFEICHFKTIAQIKKFQKFDPPKSGGLIRFWGFKKFFLGLPKHKKLIFSKNWDYMIWLHTLGDSHSTQLQGPIGRFSGELL